MEQILRIPRTGRLTVAESILASRAKSSTGKFRFMRLMQSTMHLSLGLINGCHIAGSSYCDNSLWGMKDPHDQTMW